LTGAGSGWAGDGADLAPNLVASRVSGGRIAENILQFARILRAAGIPVGPDRVILATQAVIEAGIRQPRILYAALSATLLTRPEQREVFDQAFYLFWKDPRYLEQMLSVMLPGLKLDDEQRQDEMSRRLRDTLLPHGDQQRESGKEEIELDLSESYSGLAVSRTKDFEQMSADEQRRAREAIQRMALLFAPLRTRRFGQARRGRRLDLRRMARESTRHGPDYLLPRWRERRLEPPPLVVVCDISGSMDAYARMLLHFLFALTNARDRVHCFLFGTRLFNVTRLLRGKDPDVAIAEVGTRITDWSGGTRIGESLAEFNRLWARRVLGGRATVLLFTDGLDRDAGDGIEVAARRLRASCRRLVWLNPLLRYDAYEPIAAGAKALSPHVTETRACHNLASLEALAEALSARR
jgi:hypothetical protein